MVSNKEGTVIGLSNRSVNLLEPSMKCIFSFGHECCGLVAAADIWVN